jgi:hypothetical protein
MTSDVPKFRLDPGIGVIDWQGHIVIYLRADGVIEWARRSGADFLPIDDALRAAIEADASRKK